MSRSAIGLALAVALGILVGVGGFTFIYAKGLSYLSTDPRACVNCHVMNPQYDGWTRSGHRHVATCVECHLPHDGLAKWRTKAEHGFRHSVAFTLQNFKEPIQIRSHDLDIVRANCERCHATLVAAIATSAGGAGGGGGHGAGLDCVHCHAGVGHGH